MGPRGIQGAPVSGYPAHCKRLAFLFINVADEYLLISGGSRSTRSNRGKWTNRSAGKMNKKVQEINKRGKSLRLNDTS